MNSQPLHRPKQQSFDSAEQEAFLHIWRTYDCLKAVEELLFAQYDISPQQYNALRLLESSYPAAMHTLLLGKRLISRAPDITRLLDRLEKKNWIKRQRPESNRRVVEVTITENGLQLLKAMQLDVYTMHQRQLGHLSARQRKQLVALLRAARRPHDDSSCSWLD